MTQAVEPRVVRNIADNSITCVLHYLAIRHPEKSDVKVIEPATIWARTLSVAYLAIGIREIAFFAEGEPGMTVVRRVADDYEDALLLLDAIGSFHLGSELFNNQLFRILSS